jgi:hypothetical protein
MPMGGTYLGPLADFFSQLGLRSPAAPAAERLAPDAEIIVPGAEGIVHYAESGFSTRLLEAWRVAGHSGLKGLSVSYSPIALNEFRADFALLFIEQGT